jgi:hypothetical protein
MGLSTMTKGTSKGIGFRKVVPQEVQKWSRVQRVLPIKYKQDVKRSSLPEIRNCNILPNLSEISTNIKTTNSNILLSAIYCKDGTSSFSDVSTSSGAGKTFTPNPIPDMRSLQVIKTHSIPSTIHRLQAIPANDPHSQNLSRRRMHSKHLILEIRGRLEERIPFEILIVPCPIRLVQLRFDFIPLLPIYCLAWGVRIVDKLQLIIFKSQIPWMEELITCGTAT